MKKPERFFITAIGTGSGKTLVSAIFTEAFKADYWKPVQSGLEDLDRLKVQSLVSNPLSVYHPERYLLNAPLSPHAAAFREGLSICLEDFHLPQTANHLVIEGAGGLLVPLNEKPDTMIDLMEILGVEIVLVANLYLGSINHTLLSVNELKRRELPVKGIVFNGEPNPDSERIILHCSGWPCLLRIKKEEYINQNTVQKYADTLQKHLII